MGSKAFFSYITLAIVAVTSLKACSKDDDKASASYSDFASLSQWSTYDAAGTSGLTTTGYTGGVFDGQYIYFVPYANDLDNHGEILRYNTQSTFSQSSSWEAYDPGANGVGVDPDGYLGGVYDGRYIYFAPTDNGTVYHGEVLRYDTQGTFSSAASWTTFDPSNNGVGVDPSGFYGAVFDGQYVYFVPRRNSTVGMHGEVLRYDTELAFTNTASWAAYDPSSNGLGTSPKGFWGGMFDGRYVYFVPNFNGIERNTEVMRFDTSKDFEALNSWAAYDPFVNDVGRTAKGYQGGVFDGRYLYFAPGYDGTGHHGEVLRLDTQANFSSASSWESFDPGREGKGLDPDGYFEAIFDGRYVYFVPDYNGTERHGEILRYDTQNSFSKASSWSTVDPGQQGLGANLDGYAGAVFDGQHIYFTPFLNQVGFHTNVLRLDAKSPASIPNTIYGGSDF